MSKINEVAELVEKGKAKLVGPAVQEAIDEPPFCVCPVSFLFLFSYPLIFSNLPSLLLFLTTFLSAKYPIRRFFLLG